MALSRYSGERRKDIISILLFIKWFYRLHYMGYNLIKIDLCVFKHTIKIFINCIVL